MTNLKSHVWLYKLLYEDLIYVKRWPILRIDLHEHLILTIALFDYWRLTSYLFHQTISKLTSRSINNWPLSKSGINNWKGKLTSDFDSFSPIESDQISNRISNLDVAERLKIENGQDFIDVGYRLSTEIWSFGHIFDRCSSAKTEKKTTSPEKPKFPSSRDHNCIYALY